MADFQMDKIFFYHGEFKEMDNHSTNLSLPELSLSILNSQMVAYALWIVIGFFNVVTSILTLVVFVMWKPLHTHTQVFAGNLAVCEICGSLSLIAPAIEHLYNYYSQINEIMPKRLCFPRIVWQLLFLNLLTHFHIMLSVDRFLAAIVPIFYKSRTRLYSTLSCITIWIISIGFTFSVYLDVSKSETMLVCLTRYIAGEIFVTIVISYFVLISILSVCIYLLIGIILKWQIYKAQQIDANFAEMKTRMRNRINGSLLLNAFIHFITYTSSCICSWLLSNIAITNAVIIAPYSTIMYSFGGISTFTVYYCCQQQFRSGCRFLWKRLVGCGVTQVTILSTSNTQNDRNRIELI